MSATEKVSQMEIQTKYSEGEENTGSDKTVGYVDSHESLTTYGDVGTNEKETQTDTETYYLELKQTLNMLLNEVIRQTEEWENLLDMIMTMEYFSLGLFEITFYCIEEHHHICNSRAGPPITATGTVPLPYRTVAVDPTVIPLGSYIYVDGWGKLKATDTGGAIRGNKIDIVVNTCADARRYGRIWREVSVKFN